MIRTRRFTRTLAVALVGASLAGVPALTAGATPVHVHGAAVASSSASDLRAMLNNLLQEHVYLAAGATDAALGARDAEFKAAAAALDANSVDLSKAIGSVYGSDAESAFLALWRRHIGFVVDYTVALAKKDKAMQDKAVTSLLQYTQDLGAFLSGANPNLPKDVVADLVKTHVLTLKQVIDAQAMNIEDATWDARHQTSGVSRLASATGALTHRLTHELDFATSLHDGGIVSVTRSPGWTEISSLTGVRLLPTGSARKRIVLPAPSRYSGMVNVDVELPIASPRRMRWPPWST
jgi:hypothetical protein